jgi:hypothetical protein
MKATQLTIGKASSDEFSTIRLRKRESTDQVIEAWTLQSQKFSARFDKTLSSPTEGDEGWRD